MKLWYKIKEFKKRVFKPRVRIADFFFTRDCLKHVILYNYFNKKKEKMTGHWVSF